MLRCSLVYPEIEPTWHGSTIFLSSVGPLHYLVLVSYVYRLSHVNQLYVLPFKRITPNDLNVRSWRWGRCAAELFGCVCVASQIGHGVRNATERLFVHPASAEAIPGTTKGREGWNMNGIHMVMS